MTGHPLPKWQGPGPNSGDIVRKLWFELLNDDQWHEWNKVIDKATRGTVMPGRAIRRNEANRLNRRTSPGERKMPLDEETRRLYGARDLVRSTIANNRQWFEVDPEGRIKKGESKRIRRRTYPQPDMQESQGPPAEQ